MSNVHVYYALIQSLAIWIIIMYRDELTKPEQTLDIIIIGEQHYYKNATHGRTLVRCLLKMRSK